MSEFVEYLKEAFREFGPIQARKMFGGYGIYHDGLMFGLVADDTLYLKADSESQAEFVNNGLVQFMYDKKGKKVAMSYYIAPVEALENPLQLRRWARLAFDAALRARK